MDRERANLAARVNELQRELEGEQKKPRSRTRSDLENNLAKENSALAQEMAKM